MRLRFRGTLESTRNCWTCAISFSTVRRTKVRSPTIQNSPKPPSISIPPLLEQPMTSRIRGGRPRMRFVTALRRLIALQFHPRKFTLRLSFAPNTPLRRTTVTHRGSNSWHLPSSPRRTMCPSKATFQQQATTFKANNQATSWTTRKKTLSLTCSIW